MVISTAISSCVSVTWLYFIVGFTLSCVHFLCGLFFSKAHISGSLRTKFYARNVVHFIFSSPEHEVLMVSYCGQSMSVVRRAELTIA